ncbi:nucleolar protein 8-like [Dendronephthya gigantea]|uniref:nucleolar protein 8-like n=1 Tax=Dendronephthya gigantea TaxID=151771 RepID=UPI00106C285D|nr:nucleolar protein 8-like [Dendronephthya gigantea]
MFIGGLYKEVSKDDLRLKFKPFGDVKDLEIITRHDDSGDHIKTFAYINIDISEKNFRKCLATYNKCNWKGQILKVEVAKEDYLTRLHKENQVNDEQSEANCNIPKISVIEDIKSAVPGTPVPKKRNWVVGKFGRVLPIVFLRRRDGKKIAKFDPSKTVHCLKKLRGNDFNHRHSVDSLTWNLYQSDSDFNGVDEANPTNRVSIKRSLDDNGDDNNNKNSQKIKAKNEESCFKKIKIRETLLSDETGYCQGSFKQHQKESDLIQNNESGFSTKKNSIVDDKPTSLPSMNQSSDSNTSQSTSHNSCSIEDSSSLDESITSVYSSDDNLLAPSFKNERHQENDKPSSKKRKEENKTVEKYSDDKADHLLSSNESKVQSETEESSQASKRKYSFSEISPKHESLNEHNRTNERSSSNEKSFMAAESHFKSRVKKEISNKLRLETLEERKEVLKNQKEIVKKALEKVDSSSDKGGNHIVFENDNNMDGETLKISSGREKVTGSKALAWLGMASSSDDDDNEEVDEFLGKEYFDGKSGEKLMKLQQTFGHDQRFKMDERFLESDDEIESTLETPILEEDDLAQQLKDEKRLSLKVLQDVLGTNSVFLEESEDSRNLYRDSVDTHYDPNREDHAKFEEDITKSDSPEKKLESNVVNDEPKLNEDASTKERFYTVSDSLKDFFGNKEKENKTFSFFSDLDEIEDNAENLNSAEQATVVSNWKPPVQLSQALPYDSSASESEDDVEQADSNHSSKVSTKRCLFYHPDNLEMMNALEVESSSFMRHESVESLNRYWVEVRQKMTQDYKKRRKDALRRQKRTSYKRVDH